MVEFVRFDLIFMVCVISEWGFNVLLLFWEILLIKYIDVGEWLIVVVFG